MLLLLQSYVDELLDHKNFSQKPYNTAQKYSVSNFLLVKVRIIYEIIMS